MVVYIPARKRKVCPTADYNIEMERRLFWLLVLALGLIADFLLPFWWAVAATLPIFVVSWWIVYRSDWF